MDDAVQTLSNFKTSEKDRARTQQWIAQNRERHLEAKRRYYAINRTQILEKQKAHYAAHQREILDRQKIDPAVNRARVRDWQRANPKKRNAQFKRARERLTDNYVRSTLCARTELRHKDIPDSLVSLQRAYLAALRSIKDRP
jgi:hypothetical protein